MFARDQGVGHNVSTAEVLCFQFLIVHVNYHACK